MHNDRKYISNPESVKLGNLYNEVFCKRAKFYAEKYKIKTHRDYPYSFFPAVGKTRPDFLAENFLVEVKYSSKGKIYSTNIDQLKSYINAYDIDSTKYFGCYLLVIDEISKRSYIFDAKIIVDNFKINYGYNDSYSLESLKAIYTCQWDTDLEGLFKYHSKLDDIKEEKELISL